MVPAWFAIESLVWPGLRSGIMAGDSAIGRVAFYLVESGIALGFWFSLPWAEPAALIENVAYLGFAIAFIVFRPLDIAGRLDADFNGAVAMGEHYRHYLPGVLISAAQVAVSVRKRAQKNIR